MKTKYRNFKSCSYVRNPLLSSVQIIEHYSYLLQSFQFSFFIILYAVILVYVFIFIFIAFISVFRNTKNCSIVVLYTICATFILNTRFIFKMKKRDSCQINKLIFKRKKCRTVLVI